MNVTGSGIGKPQRIIFDASVLITGFTSASHHRTGLFRVTYEILKQLVEIERYEIYLFDIFFREREVINYVQSEFRKCRRIEIYSPLFRILLFPVGNLTDLLRNREYSATGSFVRIFYSVIKNFLLITEKTAKRIEKSLNPRFRNSKPYEGFDIYFSTYFPIPVVIRSMTSLKKIYTIHDLIPVLYPEFFSSPFNALLVREVVDNIKKEDRVLCVSNSTKQDFLSIRKDLDERQVFVAPLAASEILRPVYNKNLQAKLKAKFSIPQERRYLLSVCTFEPRKNLKTLINAYKMNLENRDAEDTVLVLTGAPYWDKDPLLDEIERINSEYSGRIILTGFVSDDDLAMLYTGAYVFIYPSFYEGFGLPPLEAMQCGVPVICSGKSSLPEVVGNSGIYIDPGNFRELAEAIKLICHDPDLRMRLSAEALKQASTFCWKRTVSVLDMAFISGLNS